MRYDVDGILRNPKAWKSIPREEALRRCVFDTVAVIASHHGISTAETFDRSSPFYGDARAGHALRYYLKIGPAEDHAKPGGAPKAPAQSGANDAAPQPPPEEEPQEQGKPPPSISLTSIDSECFAPLAESVLLQYEIKGDLDLVAFVHMRVAAEKAPDKFLLEKTLSITPQAKGSIQWDGAVTDGGFDGCINLASSPYLVQLGLTPKGGAPAYTNKRSVRVELMQTELSIGDESGLGEDEDNFGVLDPLKDDVKKSGGKGKIRLNSAIFKMNNNEMNNSKSFDTYKELLHKGAPIPLFVKLWIKGKDGGRKRAPKAVSGTRILWDTLPEENATFDANLSERNVHDTAKRFLKKVADYKQGETDPSGITCHMDLGGMRAKKGDRGFAQRQWKPLGDWDAETPAQRDWGALSTCAKSDQADADAGILYYNDRMAGDKHQVAAYVDLEAKLDVKDRKLADSVPAERKSKAFILQNWREVKVTKSYKIGAGTTPLAFDGANQEFNKAALSIIPKPGLVAEDIQAQWKTAYQGVLKKYPTDLFIKNATLDDPDGYPVKYRSYNDYWEASHPDKGFFGKLWHRIVAFFGTKDEDDYRTKCDSYAYFLYRKAAPAFPLGENGLTCFKFGRDGDHNMWKDSYTAGIAPYIEGYNDRHRAVLFVFDSGQAVHTVTHEMGHNLFLAHAPGHWKPGENPGGFQQDAHNKDEHCLMSYHPEAKYFCGLCILKLSGWDYLKIHKDGKVDLDELE